MPLPKPFTGELQEQFINRCLIDPDAMEEFPQGDQRLAVCSVQWDNRDEKAEDVTNFPREGDNLNVSLSNSQYEQFDWNLTQKIKDDYPKTWSAGGNERGNEAFNLWTSARTKNQGQLTESELEWIREREAWSARHFKNFRLAGVMALAKWGTVGDIGEEEMKKVLQESMDEEDKESEEKSMVVMDKAKKGMEFTVKQIGEESDRTLRFVGSGESFDRDGDVIRVAGWLLDNYKKNPVFLYGHNWGDAPIAKCINVYVDNIAKCLVFDVKFASIEEISDGENVAEHAKFADMIYRMYLNGYMNSVSVGFSAKKYARVKAEDVPEGSQRGYEITEQELLELSAVSIPSNPDANLVKGMKSFASEIEIKEFMEFNLDKSLEELFEGHSLEDMTKTDDEPIEDTKGFNEDGVPDTWQLESDLDKSLNQNSVRWSSYTVRIFVTGPMEGQCIIVDCETNELTMHDYMYNGVESTFSVGVEVEQRYVRKALENAKIKAGATISKKTREQIEDAVEMATSIVDKLQNVIDSQEVTTDEPDDAEADDDLEKLAKKLLQVQ